MISFYKNEAGIVMYKDDTYMETEKFVIVRPATKEGATTYPDEHAAFVVSITPMAELDSIATANPDGAM
jgi:hypothetical protein